LTGLPHPPRYAHRFSQPLDALLPPRPSGLVSSRSRSWGFDPSEVSPHQSPDASRLALPLMTLAGRVATAPKRHLPPPTPPSGDGATGGSVHADSPMKVRTRRSILSWASSSPGLSPHRRWHTSYTPPPLMRFPPSPTLSKLVVVGAVALQGIAPPAGRLASFERCRPS
jgi:hypothetical protein